MNNPAITVYTLPSCVQCDMTKKWLTSRGLTFETVDLSQDAAAYEAVQELGYKAAPVVIVANGGYEAHWSGFQPARLAEHLAAAV